MYGLRSLLSSQRDCPRTQYFDFFALVVRIVQQIKYTVVYGAETSLVPAPQATCVILYSR